MRNYIIILSVFAIFCTFAACDNDEQCHRENYVMMKIGFYKSVIDTLGRQTNSTATPTITANGSGRDSLLYNGVATQYINLPLNKLSNVSSFDIIINDTIETFTVWHTNHEEYLSFECGYITFFTIDSCKIGKNYVDSVSFINNSVNTQNAENFRFYHRYDYRQ
ncbi:MAG: DUF6452 family protein [Paludibacter sp.]|nr:DUF6452 family protein [Paludibacter sp.]